MVRTTAEHVVCQRIERRDHAKGCAADAGGAHKCAGAR